MIVGATGFAAVPHKLTLSPVRAHREGGADIFEIAASRPGVAARIEVRPAWFGLRRQVRATDYDGKVLHAWGHWNIGHHDILCEDLERHIATLLDPDTRCLRVFSDETTTSVPSPGGHHQTTSRDLAETVRPDGTIVARSHYVLQQDVLEPMCVDRIPTVTRYNIQEDYFETTFQPHERPASQQVHEAVGAHTSSSVKAHLEPGGRLLLMPSGEPAREVDLFVSPADLKPDLS